MNQFVDYTGVYKKFCGVQTVESIVLIPQNFLYTSVQNNFGSHCEPSFLAICPGHFILGSCSQFVPGDTDKIRLSTFNISSKDEFFLGHTVACSLLSGATGEGSGNTE